MADNPYDWRTAPAKSIGATIYARDCGWHILLTQSGQSMNERLRPQIIGKSCVPYKVHEDQAVGLDKLNALVIGLANIASGVLETCNRL